LRRLPPEFGRAPIFASSAAGLGAILKPVERIDPVLLASVKSVVREGDVVWDVGANIGLFSVAAAALAGPRGAVYAFEPDTVLVQLLRKTAAIQGAKAASITVVPCAVANRLALRSFAIADRARASNALLGYGLTQMGNIAETQMVVTLSLDDCAPDLRPPNVLKIDVEGAEVEVLRGAAQVVHRSRPVIVCEVGGPNTIEVSKLLADAGYLFFDASKPLTVAAQRSRVTWNTIAVPREKMPPLLEKPES
jgi:FkbM family methyltransferase